MPVGDTVFRELVSIREWFCAESADGAGTDLVTANFIFDRVYSIGGGEIITIDILEFGDCEITNGDSVEADLLLTASNNNNVLEFTSDSAAFGETAWIQKKITVVASVVPVPGAVWLLGSALGLLGWLRRKPA